MLSSLLATVAAVAVGAAVVAQQRATHEVGVGGSRQGLMAAVWRRPWWRAGTAASVGASVLQAAALATGPVVVVQALIAAAVAWAAVIEAVVARRRPERATVAGVLLAVAGPVAVVVLLGPVTADGPPAAGPFAALPLIGGVVLAGAGLLWARRRPGAAGAPGLALACGVGYGLAAVLLAALARAAGTDPTGAVTDPVLWAGAVGLVVVGPASFVLSQHALARARRAGPTMTVILLADPLTAAVCGAAWFGEHVALDAAGTTGIVVAVLVAVAGIRLLTAGERAVIREPVRSPRRSTSTTGAP